MNAKSLIKDGNLSDARVMLVERVKTNPADTAARSLLFQVMLLCGEWDKAKRQLDIIASRNASPDMNQTIFEHLIQAEKERLEVFSMDRRPTFFPEIPDYSEDFFAARELLKTGTLDGAAERFSRIDDNLPQPKGTLNGEPFVGFRNTDSTLAYVIEAIEYERYLWVPIANVREMVVRPPATLLDLIWAKGRITTWEGLTMGCFFPVRYPGSTASDDDQTRMGRLTRWEDLGGGFARGLGQQVFDIGGTDCSIFEITEAVFSITSD
jgi:type VI secretion system protein ImpE